MSLPSSLLPSESIPSRLSPSTLHPSYVPAIRETESDLLYPIRIEYGESLEMLVVTYNRWIEPTESLDIAAHWSGRFDDKSFDFSGATYSINANVLTISGVVLGSSDEGDDEADYDGGDAALKALGGQAGPLFVAFTVDPLVVGITTAQIEFTGHNSGTLRAQLSHAIGNRTFTPSSGDWLIHAAGRTWSVGGSNSASITGFVLALTGMTAVIVDADYDPADDSASYDGSDSVNLPHVAANGVIPISFVGGALARRTANATMNVTTRLIEVAMNRALGGFVTVPTGITGRLNNQELTCSGFVHASGNVLRITDASLGDSDAGSSQLVYPGDNVLLVDSAGRPIPPFMIVLDATTGYRTHALQSPTTLYQSNDYELSGIQWDANNECFWACDDGGNLLRFARNGTLLNVHSLAGDLEGIALVADRPDFVYVLREGGNGSRGHIVEWQISTASIARLLMFPTEMPLGVGGSGDEGLAYVNADPNWAGHFIVGHQWTGDIYWLLPDFDEGTLTWVGMTTLSLQSNDLAAIEALDDGTIILVYDAIDRAYRIMLDADIVGASVDTASPRIVEAWNIINPSYESEAFCLVRAWSGSGVRETHSVIVGEDTGVGGRLFEYANAPLAVYPSLIGGNVTAVSAVYDWVAGELVIMFDGPIDPHDDFEPGTFALYIGNRLYDSGNDSFATTVAHIDGNTLTISGLATRPYAIDGGIAYDPDDDLLTFEGDETNLPNVEPFSDLPVTFVDGPLAVPDGQAVAAGDFGAGAGTVRLTFTIDLADSAAQRADASTGFSGHTGSNAMDFDTGPGSGYTGIESGNQKQVLITDIGNGAGGVEVAQVAYSGQATDWMLDSFSRPIPPTGPVSIVP